MFYRHFGKLIFLLVGLVNTAAANQLFAEIPPSCHDKTCFIEHAKTAYPNLLLNDFFHQVQEQPQIIRWLDRPSTSQPWYQFQRNHVSNKRLQAGHHFFKMHALTLKKIAANYQVDPYYLVAILGIETNYGKTQGNFRVGDVLYTLAFHYPRRADFFRQELESLFQLAQKTGKDALSFTGSYAGAMGAPQFMPSSYLRFSVDFDGDGFADIWHNNQDILASVANYLKQHGWQQQTPIRIPVDIQDINDHIVSLCQEDTALKHTAGFFRQQGVLIPATIGNEEPALLYRVESSPGVFDYFLGLHNFYVLWQYNHSHLYVHALAAIAEGIANKDSFS